MKKLIILLLFLSSSFILQAQYHLLYFSNDSIPKLLDDANYLFMQKKYEESNSVYRKLAEVDSLKAMSIYKIGVNEYYIGKYDSSFYYLNLAMINGYDSLEVFFDMLFVYDNKLKDIEKAFNLLTKMIGYWPGNPILYRERALYHIRLRRDVEGSKRDLEKAAELGDEVAKERLKSYK
jgi:tetratricopeptide (TPR) repeat protein